MISRSTATVGSNGVLEHVHCAPPLTLRQVHSDDRASCALCLVGTAAGPLPGDDLELSLRLRAGARATLSAPGASIAQGGLGGPAARLAISAVLGTASRLQADPGPVVVCSGAEIDIRVCIDLAADAAVLWREVVVLGRTGEAAGAVTLRWDVQREGRPVLRQYVDLREAWWAAWPGLIAGARVIASELISGPDVRARTEVRSPTSVAAQLDPHTMLLTVLGNDAVEVTDELGALRAALGSAQFPS